MRIAQSVLQQAGRREIAQPVRLEGYQPGLATERLLRTGELEYATNTDEESGTRERAISATHRDRGVQDGPRHDRLFLGVGMSLRVVAASE